MDRQTFNIALDKIKGIKTNEITHKYNVTRADVNYTLNYFKSNYKNNHMLRDQVILGGILGDGYIQKRNNNVYIYRECHSLREKEYLYWKYLILHEWIEDNSIYNKNLNNDSNNALEFCTKAKYSDVFKIYYNKTVEQVISDINIYGLLIFLLDDGWYSSHSTAGNFVISSGTLSENQLNLIIKKFNEYNIEAKLIGKRKDISISSKYNFILLSYLIILFNGLLDIDVIEKKFQKVINDYKNLLS